MCILAGAVHQPAWRHDACRCLQQRGRCARRGILADLSRVDGKLERSVYVALSGEVVKLRRFDLVQNGHKVVEVGDVAIVGEERRLSGDGVCKQGFDALLVEGTRSSLDAVHSITL